MHVGYSEPEALVGKETNNSLMNSCQLPTPGFASVS